VNHYCTYFDGGFLPQGLALWRSLAEHDKDAALWVLALDEAAAKVLRAAGGTWLRVVTLAELESADPELLRVKPVRSRMEYYFTLSPCWPRHLLRVRPEVDRVTYLDADMLFFGSPEPVFAAMDGAAASVLVTSHRFPGFLGHYERHGRFNVGILSFRNDGPGRACLEDWRARCLEWCHDRLEDGKYADQKYLEAWPARLGPALLVLDHPGVNLAPWNWQNHRYEFLPGEIRVDGVPLVLFHFARFRAAGGDWWWQSGQLDYGVMPWTLRQALYGVYWRALVAAREEVREADPSWSPPRRAARLDRAFWRTLPLRILFGTDWLRIGDSFVSGRLGLGRYTGRVLAKLRTIFLRR
jgi:hypothetical protein